MKQGNSFWRGVAALAVMAVFCTLFWWIEKDDLAETPPQLPVTAHRPEPPASAVSGSSRPSDSPDASERAGASESRAAVSAALEAIAWVPSALPAAEGTDSGGDGVNEDGENIIKGIMSKGDTVGGLLGEWSPPDVVRDYVEATGRVFPLTSFRAGQPYAVICDVQNGRVKRFEYEIDNRRRLVVEGGERPVARVEAIDYDTRLALVEGRIEDNLFQAVADMGESPQLALLLAKLFGWEINFIRDLQEGDSFSILVEKLYRDGTYRGYGRTLGATFTNKGKTYEAFLFKNARGVDQYYNAAGENLKKTLLQAPLSFTRVTSRFSHNRKHPILGVTRPHLGVDYGAPTGTPVKAVGDGVVTLRGWVGGYGNQVKLRHEAGLESMYSHLSGFARGLKEGTRVRQGQVIAFVGSTGRSTGPHLDFRLRQNGKFIDPTKAINPRSQPVGKAAMKAFRTRMALVRDYMQGRRALVQYLPEVPDAAPVVADASKKEDIPRSARKKQQGDKK